MRFEYVTSAIGAGGSGGDEWQDWHWLASKVCTSQGKPPVAPAPPSGVEEPPPPPPVAIAPDPPLLDPVPTGDPPLELEPLAAEPFDVALTDPAPPLPSAPGAPFEPPLWLADPFGFVRAGLPISLLQPPRAAATKVTMKVRCMSYLSRLERV